MKVNPGIIEDIHALTSVQEGLLYHYLGAPESSLYNEQLTLEISGGIDHGCFEQAWNFVIKTNEMLRSVFSWEKVKKPVLIVLKDFRLRPGYHDFSKKNRAKKNACVDRVTLEEKRKGFDLRDVPFRVTLCKTGKDRHTMIVYNHHILFDGWSTGIILKEFFDAYDDIAAGIEPQKPVKQKFKEFVKWTREQVEVEQEKYWKQYLEGLDLETGPLPGREKRQKNPAASGGVYRLRLEQEFTDALKAFIKTRKMTLAALIYSAWGVVLLQCGAGNDALFDTTLSVRPAQIKGIENMVGLFIDTLPVRVQTGKDESISGIMERMQRMVLEREKFGNTLSPAVRELIEDCRKYRILNSLVVIENYPLERTLTRREGRLAVHSYSYAGLTQYDLTVIITAFDDITLHVTYNTGLFGAGPLEKLVRHFTSILKKIVTAPGLEVPVSALPGLAGGVREKLLTGYKTNLFQPGLEYPAPYSAPRDELEEKLAALWAELFQVDASSLGIDTNFYDLGGHSLKASQLAAGILREFRVVVPLAEIFNHPDIRQLSGYIKNALEKGETNASIEAREKKDHYVLSSAARRIFMLQQVHPESTAYNGLWAMIVEGGAGVKRIKNSIRQLIARHESLRTSFIIVDGQPVQRIHDDVEFKIEHYDLQITDYEEIARGGQLPAHLTGGFVRPFDLSRAPLLRVGLIKTAAGKHIMMVDMHHIITDGVSTGILTREFVRFYKGEDLPHLRVQYKDFSEWQWEQIKSGQLVSQREYWLSRFAGELPVLDMPVDYRRPPVQSLEGDKIKFRLEERLHRDLHHLTRKTGTTLYMVSMAVLVILLNRYTDRHDIIVGSPFAGRNHPDLENMVGLLVETLVIRNNLPADKPFNVFLKEVKENILTAYENQSYPYGELIKQLGLSRDLRRNPLFDVMLNVREMETFDASVDVDGLRFIPLEVDCGVSRCDLLLDVIAAEEGMGGTRFELEYCSKLFKRESMERFSRFFINILNEVVKNPELQISQIEMLSDEEEGQIGQTGERKLAADFDFQGGW